MENSESRGQPQAEQRKPGWVALRLRNLPFLKLRWEGGQPKASPVKRKGRRVRLSSSPTCPTCSVSPTPAPRAGVLALSERKLRNSCLKLT